LNGKAETAIREATRVGNNCNHRQSGGANQAKTATVAVGTWFAAGRDVSINPPSSVSRTLASSAGIAYTTCMQYTLRGVPPALDTALRRRARAIDKSLNETAVLALAEGLGLAGHQAVRRDLSDIAGTWVRDPAIDAAIRAQDVVDEDLWR
jgi:hypothetical protein